MLGSAPMATSWVIVAAYTSLLVELTSLRVPSVASALSIWRGGRPLSDGYSAKYRRIFELTRIWKLVLAIPLLVVYAVYAYPAFVIWLGPDLLGDYLYAPGPLAEVLGLAMLLTGRVLAMVTAHTIRRNNEQCGESFYLHTDGLFRWSRNPGLIGMYLFVVGIWVTMPSASLLVGILFYFLYMHFKVCMEEDFLSNKFGDQYADYLVRTRRYFL